MARNKFGFPVKKKTRVARGFADGGRMSADPDAPENTLMANVGERLGSMARAPIMAVGRALTPSQPISKVKGVEKETIRVLNDLDAPVEKKQEGMKRGGKVKPKGVGCAMRGHGKGKMV